MEGAFSLSRGDLFPLFCAIQQFMFCISSAESGVLEMKGSWRGFCGWVLAITGDINIGKGIGIVKKKFYCFSVFIK